MSDVTFNLTAAQSVNLATLLEEGGATNKAAVVTFAAVSFTDGIARVTLAGRLVNKKTALKIAKILRAEH
jgi:hypothetical protein